MPLYSGIDNKAYYIAFQKYIIFIDASRDPCDHASSSNSDNQTY
ncbi:hypothetical protein SAMN06265364_10458 [Prevotella jejuni]|uniref:Uncharacterized protein n=1 Tax=Prevotella jejuni TaxID=1177574 RepID=A0AA94ISP8_9BACT|nr:hypothetical protein SAMN06265364_10458 [Prevotella jejuni]